MTDDDTAPTTASAARIYDYHLGGTHNFPVDREAAEKVTALFPQIPAMTRAGRAFLRRAVGYIADRGVRQFLDLGAGIPTQGNVHEVVDARRPDGRVVYVDNDPTAVAQGRRILHGSDRHRCLEGDLRDPESIVDNPEIKQALNFGEPIGLLLFAVLHFVPDDEQAYGIVDRYRQVLAPGSYLAISHATADGMAAGDEEGVDVVRDVYRERTATPLGTRDRAQVHRFFTGFELVEPGVVWTPQWRPAPDDPTDFTANPATSAGWVGVGRLTT